MKLLTSCEFAGRNFETMYVTSSCSNIFNQQQYPAGFLIKVTGFDCKGREMYKFQMKWIKSLSLFLYFHNEAIKS